MNRHIYRNIIATACIAAGAYACSDMDEYKDLYLKGGEISYTGKIDSVKVYSGHERVKIEGLFKADPKVTGCIIYWNNGKDSLDIPITRTDGVDTLRQIINLPENLYNFELYTYDQYGNRSVAVYATGNSYGANFLSQLANRPLKGEATSVGNKLDISFLPVDNTLGPVRTVVSYLNEEGEEDTVHVATTQDRAIINGYKENSPFSYWTEFVPDTLCIDIFKSEVTDVTPLYRGVLLECIACSSEELDDEASGTQGHASQSVDNDVNTYWHSEHTPNRPNYPHWLAYDMHKEYTLSYFEVVGRIGAGSQFKDFEIWSKVNEEDEWELVQTFERQNYQQGEVERFYFDEPLNARYLKIVMINGYTGDPYTFLAELWVYPKE